MDSSTNTYLLSQAIHIDHDPPHIFEEYSLQKPYEYAKLAGTDPVGIAIMARYQALFSALNDGEMSLLRVTQDGKLMVDASITVGAITVNTNPITWTRRYYEKSIAITNVDTTINFGFICDQMQIINDDLANSVWINYGAAAVADNTHDEIAAGEVFEDQFRTNNVHIITNVVGPLTIRVWARAAV